MNRWFLSIASLAVLGSAVLTGCSEKGSDYASGTTGGTTTPKTDASGTESPKTDTPKTDTSTTDPAKTDSKPTADAPIADKPKDGDDVAVIDTAMGKIVVMFYPSKAPRHVENFLSLAKAGFYNGTRFHRCIPGFMVQGGDPNSKDKTKADRWGTGGHMGADGKEVNVTAEFNEIKHVRGILSMARSGDPNSASSQFFIMVNDTPSLDGQYSAFGKVVSGLEVADKIVATGGPGDGKVDPEKAVVLKSVTVTKWPVK